MTGHTTPTIAQAARKYIDSVSLARSANTARTYNNALSAFLEVLRQNKINPDDKSPNDLPEEAIAWFAMALKDKSPATERLYLIATAGFYEYLAAERLTSPNLPRVRMLIRQRSRRPGQRLPIPAKRHRDSTELCNKYCDTAVERPHRTPAQLARSGFPAHPGRHRLACP